MKPILATPLLALALVAAGCGSNGQSTLDPASHPAHRIADLWWLMFIGSAVIFAVVVMLMMTAVIRRRGRVGEPASRTPAGSRLVIGGGVVFPAIVLVALFAVTVRALPSTSASASGDSRLTIDVTGKQWFWDVRYPQQRFATANEIHIPVGEPVTIRVRTADVAHSFWVPELNRKIDMIPGETNAITLEAQRPGVYAGQCAEFCGIQHANMGFLVIADPPATFQRWLADQQRPAATPASAQAVAGQRVFLGSTCADCHTIVGTSAAGEIGPDLTHLGSRMTLAARTIANSSGGLAEWVLDPQHVKPGNEMPPTDITRGDFQPLLAYLETLK